MCDTDYAGWAIREERDPVKRMAMLQEDPFVAPEIKKAAAAAAEWQKRKKENFPTALVAPEIKGTEARAAAANRMETVMAMAGMGMAQYLAHPAPATPPAPKRARAVPDAPKKPDSVVLTDGTVLREVASASVRVRVSDDLTPTVLGTTVTHPRLIHRGTTVTRDWSSAREEDRRSGFWKRGGENEAHGMCAELKCSCERTITIRVECLENKDSDSSSCACGMRAELKCSCGKPITIRVECLENKDSDSDSDSSSCACCSD